jgi:mannose-6-phosphate isomerase-like protein (cupin superfamily)
VKRRFPALILLPLAALSQQAVLAQQGTPAVAPTTHEEPSFITAEEVAARIAKADDAIKAGKPANPGALLQLDYFRGSMQYLTEPMKQYAMHLEEEELFIVLDGSGIMNLGATMIDPKRGVGATTLVSDKARGGTDHHLTKGDMFILPMNTARCVTQVDGKLVMMSMRLPHTPAAGSAAPSK